jgi:outer membrane protein assembly factor BamB
MEYVGEPCGEGCTPPSGSLYALDGATGAQKWAVKIGGRPAAVLGPNGTVLVAFYYGTVYALDGATGASKWAFPSTAVLPGTDAEARAQGGGPGEMAIGRDGTVYVAGDGTYTKSFRSEIDALDGATGKLKWSSPTSDFLGGGSLAIGAGGTVYATGSALSPAGIVAIDPATAMSKWTFSPASASILYSQLALGAGETVYAAYGIIENSAVSIAVYALDGATGMKRWALPTGNRIPPTPALGPDGTVYVTVDSTQALDGATGAQKWTTSGVAGNQAPVLGADGTVYLLGGLNDIVYALDGVTGRLKWEFPIGRGWATLPAIGRDGTAYVGVALFSGTTGFTRTDAVYAIHP